jgi:pyruvate/2-oxoglutarate dehydrogenase complex dihydrolipoamide dehydrogenase (E3) component
VFKSFIRQDIFKNFIQYVAIIGSGYIGLEFSDVYTVFFFNIGLFVRIIHSVSVFGENSLKGFRFRGNFH